MDLTSISKAVGTERAGIIEYNFMGKYRVVIDYPHQKILFEKAPAPTETQNDSTTTLELFSFILSISPSLLGRMCAHHGRLFSLSKRTQMKKGKTV